MEAIAEKMEQEEVTEKEVFREEENAQDKNILECLLFATKKPVRVEALAKAAGWKKEKVLSALEALQKDYVARGLDIFEIAGGYQLGTKPEYSDYVKKLLAPPSRALSKASLETLAIVAYKQPLTRQEIEKLRGVNVDSVIDQLLTRRLIKISGKKDVPGHPFLFVTTPEFLNFLGMKDLSQLPPLPKELKDFSAAFIHDAPHLLEETEMPVSPEETQEVESLQEPAAESQLVESLSES